MLDLGQMAVDFADGLARADHRRPQASNSRTGQSFQPGIGPHTEAQTVDLVMHELSATFGDRYQNYGLNVPYADLTRFRCDLCLGVSPAWQWAIEVKMLRFM